MATKKVGIYRNYYGPIPKDSSGQPLPKSQWTKKRAHSWVVRWFESEGQRCSKSFPGRKEADRFAEEKQREVREEKTAVGQDMALREFSDMYLTIRSDVTDRTMQEHARVLRFLREQMGEDRVLRDITPMDARRFISWYRQRTRKEMPLSRHTGNKVLRECRRIFREAVDCRLIRSNPFDGMRQERVGQTDWHHVAPEEYGRLIHACPSRRWQGMIMLAYCCGLRLGEVLNLTWSDIDFEGELLRVTSKRGGPGLAQWTPKDKDQRIVPLPRPAMSILTELQAAAGEGQVYVFVTGKGSHQGHRIARANCWRDFQAIRRRAGVPECSMHDLRKSYCTNLSAKVPMHVVQDLAGHKDIRTTRRYYLQVQPEHLQAVRQAVEATMES